MESHTDSTGGGDDSSILPEGILDSIMTKLKQISLDNSTAAATKGNSGRGGRAKDCGNSDCASVNPGGSCGGGKLGELAESLSLVHDFTRRMMSSMSLLDTPLPTVSSPAADREPDGPGNAPKSLLALNSAKSRVLFPRSLRNLDTPSGLLNGLRSLLGSNFGDRTDILGRTALHVAVAEGRNDLVVALITSGCSADQELPFDYRTIQRHGLTPPGVQINDSSVVAKWLRRAQRDPHPRKRARLATGLPTALPSVYSMQYSTPLHWAALDGNLVAVEAILSSPLRVNVNARTAQGATPLHCACNAGFADVVARLCRAPGIDLNAEDDENRTPLHHAAALGHSEVVEQLWSRGAQIDPGDLYAWRPLHYAACEGHASVAASLIIAGSHVQAFDADVR